MEPSAVPTSPWGPFACVAFGVYMATLDGSIVNVALPSILRDFQVPLGTVQWVVGVYLLVITGTLLGFGRLADLFGHRRLYLAGLALFTAGSLLCSLSSGPWRLVTSRAVQGLGASMVMACSPAVVAAVFPPHRRGRGLGLMGTVVALGLTTGPPLGGFLLGLWGWRSLFLVNLPVGLVALALSVRLLPALRFARRRESFDLAGAVLFTVGCGAALTFLDALSQATALSARVWGTAAAAVAGLTAFVAREGRVADPLLDLGLFRNRDFSAAVAAAVLSYLSGFVVVLLVPFYLSQVKGMGPQSMGLTLTVTPLLMSVLAPWAGALSDRWGYRRLTALGLWFRTAALAVLFLVGPASPLVLAVLGLALLGIGNAFFNPPNTSAIMGSVPVERLGVAGGVAAVARNLGMSLGVGLGGSTFSGLFRLRGGTSLAAYLPSDAGAFTAGWRGAMAAGLAACLAAQWVSSARAVDPVMPEAES